MNFQLVFAVVCIFACTEATHTGSLQISGTFKKHPLFANHPFISKKFLTKPMETNVIPDSTVPIMPVIVEMPVPAPMPTHSFNFNSNIDVQKIVNDLVGVKIALLRHFQNGVARKFDQKVESLEKFGQQVDNHFSKGSSTGAVAGADAVADAGSVSFDANLSVSDGTRIAAPVVVPLDTETTNCGSDPVSDFIVTDSTLVKK